MLDLQRDLGLSYLSALMTCRSSLVAGAALVVCAIQAYLDTQIRREARNAVHRPGVPSSRSLASLADPVRAARQAHTADRRILVVMKPARAASRRSLPTSPFGPPSPAPPAEQFALRDQVTHDTYGLGRVLGVEVDTALLIDFGSCRVRIMTPCAKLTKL